MTTNSKQPRPTAAINSKLNKNLTAYVAAASAAGATMLALTPSAEAKVIYTQTHTRLSAITLDINHDGVFDFVIRDEGGCVSERNGSICGGLLMLNASSYTKGHFMKAPGFASALFAGAKIGPTAQFNAGEIIGSDFYRFFSGTITPPTWSGPFANGGKGVRDRYIGLKFNIGPQAHYGWMRISVQIPNSQSPDSSGRSPDTLTKLSRILRSSPARQPARANPPGQWPIRLSRSPLLQVSGCWPAEPTASRSGVVKKKQLTRISAS